MTPMPFETRRSLAVIIMTALLVSACTGLESAPRLSAEPPAPARPVPTLASLTGVGPAAVRSALGKPAFKRTETGAEIWQYGTGQCRLFVYFYNGEGETAAGLTSAHIDARQANGGASDVGACLGEIVQAQPSGR